MRDLAWLLFWRTHTREDRDAFIRTLHEIRSLPTTYITWRYR